MVVGRAPTPIGWGGGPFTYATLFIDDLGANGSGDLLSVSAYRQEEPFGCLAAQEYPGAPLITGDVDVNGSGGGRHSRRSGHGRRIRLVPNPAAVHESTASTSSPCGMPPAP